MLLREQKCNIVHVAGGSTSTRGQHVRHGCIEERILDTYARARWGMVNWQALQPERMHFNDHRGLV